MARCRTVLAKVQITLEVDVGSWSDTTTMKQIEDQGKEEAVGKVRRILTENLKGGDASVRAVGDPVITRIYAVER